MPSFDGGAQGRFRPRRVALLCLASCLIGAAPASAAPGWLKPADLSLPGRDADSPEIVMDNAGNTIAMWDRQKTSPGVNLQVSTRAPGAAFSSPAVLVDPIEDFDLAMTPGGEAAVAWRRLEGLRVIQVATMPPGGSFSAPVTVYTEPSDLIPQELDVAVGEGGNVAVSWRTVNPEPELEKLICGKNPNFPFNDIPCTSPSFVMASVRRAGGSFSSPVRVSPPRVTAPEGSEEEEKEWEIEESRRSAAEGRVAIDSDGNAVAVWSYSDGTGKTRVIQSAAREGESFGAPAQVSASGGIAGEPTIGMDAAGKAIAVWSRSENEGAPSAIQASVRPPGGSFAAVLGNVSTGAGPAQSPSLAVNSGGTATIAWLLDGASEDFIQTATRPPDGAFSGPLSLSNGKDNPQFADVAMNDAGAAIVAWSGDNAGNKISRATVRPAGGSFGAPVAISQSSPSLFHPHVAMDLAGDGTVVWTRNNGTHNIVQMAGYDGSAPELRDVSIPASAKVGDLLSFSATSVDAWPIGPPHFSFGDGGEGDGSSVSHAYSAPGSYVVTATATDAAGTPTTTTGTILVKARNDIKIGKLSRNRRTGTATLAVTVLEPGSVVVSGKGIKKATVRSARGGTVKMPVKAAGKGLKTLNERGKLKVKLKVAYSPDGGDKNSAKRKVTLFKILG